MSDADHATLLRVRLLRNLVKKFTDSGKAAAAAATAGGASTNTESEGLLARLNAMILQGRACTLTELAAIEALVRTLSRSERDVPPARSPPTPSAQAPLATHFESGVSVAQDAMSAQEVMEDACATKNTQPHNSVRCRVSGELEARRPPERLNAAELRRPKAAPLIPRAIKRRRQSQQPLPTQHNRMINGTVILPLTAENLATLPREKPPVGRVQRCTDAGKAGAWKNPFIDNTT